jgi:hypothetical protein
MEENNLPAMCLNSLPEDPLPLLLFLEAKESVTEGTRYGYAKALRAIYANAGQDVPTLLNLYGRSVGRDANTETPRQALPVPRDHLMTHTQSQHPVLRLAFWLAAKTSSRMDEVLKLNRDSFLHVTSDEIVIAWNTPALQSTRVGRAELLKTAKTNRFQLQFYTVVTDPQPMVEIVAFLRSCPPGRRRLFPFTTQMCERILSQVPLLEEHARLVALEPDMHLPHYSAHSMKQQGTKVMLRLAAEGLIPPEVIATVAKHRSSAVVLPSNTVRYGWRDANLARLNGSGKATFHL